MPQVFVGLRYIYQSHEYRFELPFFTPGSSNSDEHSVLIELGGAKNISLFGDYRHSVVMSGTVAGGYTRQGIEDSFVGYVDSLSGFSLRWEMAAGYQWAFTERMQLLLRYRALFETAYGLDHPVLDDGDVQYRHGPEIGIGFTF